MTAKGMSWAWHVEGITPVEKLALMGLTNNGHHNGVCFGNLVRNAMQDGLTEAEATMVAASLEARGLVKQFTLGDDGKQWVVIQPNAPGRAFDDAEFGDMYPDRVAAAARRA